MKPSTARALSPARNASKTGAMAACVDSIRSGPSVVTGSAGSMSTSEWTISGASRASWSAMFPPEECPTRCAPRSRGGASAPAGAPPAARCSPARPRGRCPHTRRDGSSPRGIDRSRAGSSRSGLNQSAKMPAWTSTIGTPLPLVSYSSSRPSTFARLIGLAALCRSDPDVLRHSHLGCGPQVTMAMTMRWTLSWCGPSLSMRVSVRAATLVPEAA